MRPKLFAAILAIGIIVVVALDDTQRLGPLMVVYRIPYGDKAAHFLVFGLLSMFANLAAYEKWPKVARPMLALRIGGALALMMALEELSQLLIPWRKASIWDVAAGYLGLVLFSLLALFIAGGNRPRDAV